MTTKRPVFAVLLSSTALFAVACGRTQAKLTPAPTAAAVSGPGRGATATVAGVQFVARAGAWSWDPRDLDKEATPILVELHNASSIPVTVRYNRITLTDEAGHKFAAMPPYDVDATISEPFTVRNPYYGFDRFEIAPYLRRWYPAFRGYNGAFLYDAAYYGPYVTRYREVKLPTVDMIQRALPEGVLSPGGHAEGFVYFEALDRDAGTVTLGFDVVNAASGAVVGAAKIPFVAR